MSGALILETASEPQCNRSHHRGIVGTPGTMMTPTIVAANPPLYNAPTPAVPPGGNAEAIALLYSSSEASIVPPSSSCKTVLTCLCKAGMFPHHAQPDIQRARSHTANEYEVFKPSSNGGVSPW